MSIANELTRLLQAKSDLATSIANKGVTVPAATTLDGYAALVDQIQQGGGSLPYDAEIEYLQSDGSAYIDTGILTTSNIKVVASLTVLSGVSDVAIYGGRVALNNNSNALFCLSSNNRWSWRYGNVNKNLSNTTITGSFIINNKADVKTLVFKGSLNTSIVSDAATFTTIYPMYIFSMNNGGTVGSISSNVRIKRFVMYNGSTLVRDYIPVRKNSVGYLYDKVSGELFGNANSSGAFTYGNDVT